MLFRCLLLTFFLTFVFTLPRPIMAYDNGDLLNAFDKEITSSKAYDALDFLDELDEDLNHAEKDADPELLDELGQEYKKEPDSRKIDLFKMLGRNLGGIFRIRGQHFWQGPDRSQNPNVETESDFAEGLLELSTWTGTKRWRLSMSGWLEAGTHKHTWAGHSEWFQDRDRRRRYLELNEIYLRWYQEEYDLTIGKKVFKNGITPLYSPADRYSPKDYNDPLDTKELGIWQVQADYYYKNIVMTGAILPVYQASKNPHEDSRWIGSSVDFKFPGLLFRVEEDIPRVAFSNISYFGRVKATAWGWDLFASAYHGLNPFYVLKVENEDAIVDDLIDPAMFQAMGVTKDVVKVGNIAMGFSTTYNKWEFHGEGLYNYSYRSKDDNYLNYVGGITYNIDDMAKKIFMEQIEITVDYAGEWLMKKQSARGYISSSENSRFGRNDLIGRMNVKVNEDLSFQVTSVFQLGEEGRYTQCEGKYMLREGLFLIVGVEEFNGPNDSYFGRWDKNDRVIGALKYSF